jgi:hypothetical protein
MEEVSFLNRAYITVSDLERVLKALKVLRKTCYITDFKARNITTSRRQTVIAVLLPALQGLPPWGDLQAHTSVHRLLFVVDVTHPEVIVPSPSTVIRLQVCIVYSTGTEGIDCDCKTLISKIHA